MGAALRQVVADGAEEGVVVEQPVELGQLRLEPEAELGYEGEQVGGRVAVAEHRTRPRRRAIGSRTVPGRHLLGPYQTP